MLLPEWQMFPVVQALQSMRGVSIIVAATTIAEIGDLKRFHNPSELMSYPGLVPSENSSGQKARRGSITKSKNNYTPGDFIGIPHGVHGITQSQADHEQTE